MNLLLGFERAIVSATAGTTRDTIEEVINLGGLPLRLVDTAGLRDSDDAIEQEGIARTENQIAEADLVLEIVDANVAAESVDRVEIPKGVRHLLVLNKTDLGMDDSWKTLGGIPFSCVEETGVEGLTSAIPEALAAGDSAWGADEVAINARHKHCLVKAGDYCAAALECMKRDEPPEITSIELRSALEAVGEVVGKADVEELLGVIFSQFCIGK